MFKITRKKGFHIKFENGYTVSVQFGPGNYCSNYDREIGRDEEKCGSVGSPDAECAVWKEGGELLPHFENGNTVCGQMSPKEVLELMNWAASQ